MNSVKDPEGNRPDLFEKRHDERYRTSVHEAGHGVIGLLFGRRVEFLSILPTEHYLGVASHARAYLRPRSYIPEPTVPAIMWHAHLRRLLETDVCISLAGGLAEELGVRMRPSEPAREDRKKARKLAFDLASMSNRELAALAETEAAPAFPSDQEQAQAMAETLSGEQASAHMRYLREVTRSLVHQPSIRDAILAVADKLYDEEILSGRAVKQITDIAPFVRRRRKEQ